MENKPDHTRKTLDKDPAEGKHERLGNFSSREEEIWWEEHIIFG